LGRERKKKEKRKERIQVQRIEREKSEAEQKAVKLQCNQKSEECMAIYRNVWRLGS